MTESSSGGFKLSRIITVIAVAMSLFQIYTGVMGVDNPLRQRIIHLAFGLVLVFLTNRLGTGRLTGKKALAVDLFLIGAVLCSLGYLLVNFDYVVGERINFITPLSTLEKALGLLLVIAVLEGTRRLTGFALVILAAVALAYPFAGPFLPGPLNHGGYSFERVIDVLYLSVEGIFGLPLAVSAAYVALYIIFGAFLNETGLGRFFIQFSQAYVGHLPGGPAKVSIVGSGFMGMISGSAVGNVVTTGTFTIPMMKDIGYKPHYAGAVEAIASTGGIIMPPVMGSVAFIMAELTGTPYGRIIQYAFIPAVLYYLSLYFMVHLEAVKIGLKGLPKSSLPKGKEILKKNWHLTIPIMVLVYFLVKQYTATMAVIYSLFSLIVVSNFRRETRLSARRFLQALENGARGVLVVIMAVASAGIIVGMVNLTGLGIRLTSVLLAIAGGNLYATLVLTAAASMILGMGLPGVVSYILLAALVVPALLKLGVPMIPAHFFIIFFSISAFFTPPFCTAVYAAAGIAKSPIMKTGYTAMRIGSACYIIPFMFVLEPTLLGMGSVWHVALSFVTSLVGIFLLAAAVEGFFRAPIALPGRLIAAAGALLLIRPGIVTDLIGLGCLAGLFLVQKMKAGRSFHKDSIR